MKKLLALLMAAGMMLSVAACGSDNGSAAVASSKSEAPAETATETAGETAAASAGENGTAEGRTFTVGFDAEYPPYGYKDESGEYTGFGTGAGGL